MVKSHIIPKFVFDWIKKTSATGYLRFGIEPNLRRQDGPKEKLLCNQCEVRLSVWEGKFSKEIFTPYQKEIDSAIPKTFKYQIWLKRFVVSLALRVSLTSENAKKLKPPLSGILSTAILDWRGFLLGVKNNIEEEFHLFFSGAVADPGDVSLPSDFNFYMVRGVDTNPFFNYRTNQLGIYIKLPSIIMAGFISPKKAKNWHGTKINNSGTIRTPQRLEDSRFGDFIVMRAGISNERSSKISDKQQKKIIKSLMKKSPRHIMDSGTFEAMLDQRRLDKLVKERRKK